MKTVLQLLILLLLFVLPVAYGEEVPSKFKQQFLQNPMMVLPHYQTALGRESYRYAGHPNNKYRLYDFYKRQAIYHMELGKAGAIQPYPGMEGGRLGHWGSSNNSGTIAYPREVGPEYPTLTTRALKKDLGIHYIRLSEGMLATYDSNTASFKNVYANAKLSVPPKTLAGKIDRWGMSVTLTGQEICTAAAAIPAGAFYTGHHVCGDEIIHQVRWHDSGDSYISFTARKFAGGTLVQEAIEAVTALPAIAYSDLRATDTRKGRVTIVGDSRSITNNKQVQLTLVSRLDGSKVAVTYGARSIDIAPLSKGDAVMISHWFGPSGKQNAAAATMSKHIAPLPSSILKKKSRAYLNTYPATLKRNADRAAAGTAYEIDDIDVPLANKENAPMTLSSIAFTQDGTAYLSTMIGDVWRVTGLGTDGPIEWRQYGGGLSMPLGMQIVNGVPCVLTKCGLLLLKDLNNDGEADFYERFEKIKIPTKSGQATNKGLRQDSDGNLFYFNNDGMYQVAADGTSYRTIGDYARQPLGIALTHEGILISDASEGGQENGTCSLRESAHPSNQNSKAKSKRILYLPRGIDSSAGGKILAKDPRFGPLATSLLGASYGNATYYQILRDPNDGSPQAALVKLPGTFAAGPRDMAVNPIDGQVYAAGFDGWGDFAVAEGSLHRVRYTGKPTLIPVAWHARIDGISVTFNHPIDPASLDPKKTFAQQWNYRDPQSGYGSAEYSVRSPEQLGHDRLPVTDLSVEGDGKTVFFKTEGLLPAMSVHLYMSKLRSQNGLTRELDLYGTINELQGLTPDAPRLALTVPVWKAKGSTALLLANHFAKVNGFDKLERSVGPEVAYKPADLSYEWLSRNVISKQCMPCHAAGMPHDYTHYEGFIKTVNPTTISFSPLLGMLKTDSMPPYPLPKASDSVKQAIIDWVQAGAKK